VVAFPPAVAVVVIGVGAGGLAVEPVAGGEPVGTGFVRKKRPSPVFIFEQLPALRTKRFEKNHMPILLS
jgi:hypothetical protein